jgi:hypothetical protein
VFSVNKIILTPRKTFVKRFLGKAIFGEMGILEHAGRKEL